ncbi:peptidase M23-like protein [Kribbella sp. VKM Ac-2527]|uniref:Peptidase M23-like protein n=1 Tax=Kribbella caucasensis TaxID=2512215 RepID=A0A4R6KQ24_9ACTN|nr:phage tail tip lysozyme [Kribbella sp. VKM Ac-2527]TDO54641.1 peptidase M23-like protein [Kribbella sp. VKM Ac-2527]
MADSKATPLLGGLALLLLLPMIIVAAMLFTAMGAIGQENPCASEPQGKAFVWPTDVHDEPSEGFDDEGAEKHEGIDYDADEDSPVRAAERGKVVSTEGDWIKIEHAQGRVQTWYKFVKNKSVSNGEEVDRGEEIGKVGTGEEDEPGEDGAHLHFELRIKDGGNWVAKDPTDEIGDDVADSGGACACGGPLVGGNNQEKAFNFFVSNGYSKEQAAGIVGNMIHESSVEPARLQGTSPGTITHPSAAINSELGWGIVQWTPAGKMIEPSMNATDNDEAKVESLEWQLEFLRKQLEGEGPVPEGNAGTQLKATSTPEDAAVAFGRYYERFAGSDNLNHERYTQRKTAARQVFQTFGGGGEGAAPGGCGAGNGDIAATAKMLAWDTPGHGKDRGDAKPEYAEAMDEYNGATTDDPYSDCGVFVATVMHMSGADPEYPKRSTGVQEDYLRNSGKYDVYDDITVDELRPGDILIGPGHTYLFVGEFNGYNSAAGSLHDHVPEAGHAYSIGNQFAAARLKNPPQPQGD